jgi:RNA polymerase sigma-70 factor (ECF subfamily)
VSALKATVAIDSTPDELYHDAARVHGAALGRLARAYEAEADLRRDLLQEIYIALWRSFSTFDGRCSLRTWIYRVAHNVAASHVLRQRRMRSQALVGLEELEKTPDGNNTLETADRSYPLDRW